jgi:hypothetical protein
MRDKEIEKERDENKNPGERWVAEIVLNNLLKFFPSVSFLRLTVLLVFTWNLFFYIIEVLNESSIKEGLTAVGYLIGFFTNQI